MGKLQELKTTAELVKTILAESKEARNNDGILYSMVLTAIGKRVGVNLDEMSVTRFFCELPSLAAVPGPETVRRARQKFRPPTQNLPQTNVSGGSEGNARPSTGLLRRGRRYELPQEDHQTV